VGGLLGKKSSTPKVPPPTPAPIADDEASRRRGLRAIAELSARSGAESTRLTSRLGDSEEPEKRETTLGGRSV
jgi:hypothetical protein